MQMFILLDLLNFHYKTDDHIAETALSMFVLYLENVFLSCFFFPPISVKFMLLIAKLVMRKDSLYLCRQLKWMLKQNFRHTNTLGRV